MIQSYTAYFKLWGGQLQVKEKATERGDLFLMLGKLAVVGDDNGEAEDDHSAKTKKHASYLCAGNQDEQATNKDDWGEK